MTYVPKISYNDMYLYVYMYTHYDIIYIHISLYDCEGRSVEGSLQ